MKFHTYIHQTDYELQVRICGGGYVGKADLNLDSSVVAEEDLEAHVLKAFRNARKKARENILEALKDEMRKWEQVKKETDKALNNLQQNLLELESKESAHE